MIFVDVLVRHFEHFHTFSDQTIVQQLNHLAHLHPKFLHHCGLLFLFALIFVHFDLNLKIFKLNHLFSLPLIFIKHILHNSKGVASFIGQFFTCSTSWCSNTLCVASYGHCFLKFGGKFYGKI